MSLLTFSEACKGNMPRKGSMESTPNEMVDDLIGRGRGTYQPSQVQ